LHRFLASLLLQGLPYFFILYRVTDVCIAFSGRFFSCTAFGGFFRLVCPGTAAPFFAKSLQDKDLKPFEWPPPPYAGFVEFPLFAWVFRSFSLWFLRAFRLVFLG
jgi:hypothetical protein